MPVLRVASLALLLASAGVVGVAPSAAHAGSYTVTASYPIPVPDGGITTAPVDVSGAVGTITDVDVVLSGLGHSQPADLDIEVISPDGTAVALWSDVCKGGPLVGTSFTFSDEGVGTLPGLSDCAPYDGGVVKPSNQEDPDPEAFTVANPLATLSAFDGEDPNGTWTLSLGDDLATHVGSLTGFSLKITTMAPDVRAPATTVTKAPKSSTKTRAKIVFKADEAGATFACKIDKRAFKPCSSPLKLKNLKVAKHKVQVRATDKAGNQGKPVKIVWKTLKKA